MDVKECKDCGMVKPISQYYTQEKLNSKGEKYIYVPPYCKECTSKRAKKWQEENYERYREGYLRRSRKARENPERLAYNRMYAYMQRITGYQKEYQRKNKEKFKMYQIHRKQNKTHEISDAEWQRCLNYFDYSCAYCGISEKEAKKIYGQKLHKEHVDHNGSNDLSNNVPACKSCNSRKWTYEFEEWYNENNEIFSQERKEKILKWINGDYKLYLDENYNNN